MRYRRIVMLLVFVLLFALCATPALAADNSFEDTAGHWAEEAIDRWSSLEVIIGSDGKFRPDDSITRGEMALIIDRICKYVDVAENPFSDLEDEQWYTDAVLKCNAQGVMIGSAGKVRPKDTIKREEAMLMIARTLGLDDVVTDTELPYDDADSISDWAYSVVAMLYDGGYLTDSTDMVRPREDITRAEVVNLLDNLIAELWRSSGLYTVDVEGNAVIAAEQFMLINSHISGDLIIAGGATEKVLLTNTVVDGDIINVSGAEIMYDDDRNIITSRGEYTALGVRLNTYAASGFSTDSKGRIHYDYDGVTSRTGIDVSEWQKEIDWEAVAEDGIEFAFIRVGYRGNTLGKLNKDAYMDENIVGAQEAGLDVGVYFYAQAINEEEAIEEAEYVLDLIEDYDIDYPIVYDWEWAGTSDARTNDISNEMLTKCFVAFCETIEDAGYDAMVYFNTSTAYDNLDLTQLKDYYFWYASYNNMPEFYYYFDMWQYSDAGSVDGIEGRVDMNIAFVHF